MLKNLNPIDRLSGVNCAQLSVFNILKYKGFTHFPGIFKQCGLHYIKNKNDNIGFLRGKYMKAIDELKMVHGIELIELSVNDEQKLIKELKYYIQNDEPIMLSVDLFNLKDNLFYQKKHIKHVLLVVDFDNEYFKVVDDAYRYVGNLTYAELIKAATNDKNKGLNNYEYAYISLENTIINPPHEEYEKVVNLNYTHLIGQVSEKEKVQIAKFSGVSKNRIAVGVESIQKFIEDYQKYVIGGNIKDEELFYNLYLSFMEVAVSHYRYSMFLQEASTNKISSTSRVDMFQELSQDWQVAANMSLKCMYKGDNVMINRIMNKLNNNKEKEVDYLKKIAK